MLSKKAKIIIISFVVFVFLIAIFFKFSDIYKVFNPRNNGDFLDEESQRIVENRQAGDVGEITSQNEETGEEESVITPDMPGVITSTVGRVLKIEGSILVLQGEGSNFADLKSRELKVAINEGTLIFDENQKQFNYEEGKLLLKEGLNVLVEGEGNIRGKTEFNVITLNILAY